MIRAAFAHVNLVARDWRALAGFYQAVFGCEVVPPERDYAGPDLAAATGIPGAHLRGVHLRLPSSTDGPTLEVYAYDELAPTTFPAVNRPGFGHIAFAVESVEEARAAFLAAGGSVVGEVVTSTTSAGTRVTWCYVRDPEGNVVELQRWG